MFNVPDSRLSSSNSAILGSSYFFVPVTLQSVAKTSETAFEGLRHGFEAFKGLVAQLGASIPGIELIGFNEPVLPGISRVEIEIDGKDYHFSLTFALRCAIPAETDFWGRIHLISGVYDRLSGLGAKFQDKKGIELILEEAKLEQQKPDAG